MSITKNRLLLFLSLVLIPGPKLNVKVLKNPNPTSYTFQFPLTKVKASILKRFSNFTYHSMSLDTIGKITLAPNGRNILENPDNKNDYILYKPGVLAKSRIYFDKEWNPLDYYAWFHLHLSEANNTTKVEVITKDALVVTGQKLLPSLPHFVRMDKFIYVNPSTIEEYEILRMIGKGLGVEDKMPALVLP